MDFLEKEYLELFRNINLFQKKYQGNLSKFLDGTILNKLKKIDPTFLSKEELQELDSILNSERVKKLKEDYSGISGLLTTETRETIGDELINQIHQGMSSEQKQKYSPRCIKMRSMNLGIINVSYLGNNQKPIQNIKQASYLFKNNPEALQKLIVNYHTKKLEKVKPEETYAVLEIIKQEIKNMDLNLE